MSWRRKPEQDDAPLDASEVRRLAMNLLARREHSRQELFDKLSRRNVDEEVLAAAIDRLSGQDLQSDQRFAQNYSRSRLQSGQGPVRIRKELEQRGVNATLIAEAVESLEADWDALAAAARCKRFGESPPRDYKEKSRQSRFLNYRGFTHEQIRSAMMDAAAD